VNPPRTHGGKRRNAGRKLSPKTVLKKLEQEQRIEAAEEAFKFELHLMRDGKVTPSVRMACAQDIQDRVFGKAKQSMEHSGEVTLFWEKILKRSWQ
jgi:hypothetical protein